MDQVWALLQEFGSTLGTLAKAQSILLLFITTWVFTTVWIYATERNLHGKARPGYAWLGLFWLPGLLIYYLFPKNSSAEQKSVDTPMLNQTPETIEAPYPEKRQEEIATFDGNTHITTVSKEEKWDEETDDGAIQPSPSPRRPTPCGFVLTLLKGPMRGKQYSSPKDKRSVYIGSRSNNDIKITQETIAPWHVALSYEDNQQWVLRVVEHAKTKYVTKVNGLNATVKPLNQGDKIQLGDLSFKFHLE